MNRLLIGLLALTIAACGTDDDAKSDPTPAQDGGPTDASAGDSTDDGASNDATAMDVDPGTASFVVQGSVEQVFVTHAVAEQALELRDGKDAKVAVGAADHLGSLIFRKVAPGAGYRVHTVAPTATAYSAAVTVLGVAESKPIQAFYDGQKISAGLGYITVRDGTRLAYFATLPGPAEEGPYPTIVNYSGYDPARPGKPVVSEAQKVYCQVMPVLCDAPSDASALMAAVGGYATVSVNMRGTGCSGGAYDYFETLQLLDGYDIIETVAAQPWVANHKVGMTGLSYPGITQLFVAKMQPPGLAAITPLSVIGNTATTLVPGGILNNGFALSWIEHVYKRAAPYGQGWEQKRVDAGDTICEENQLLHDQRVNNVEQAKDTAYYQPSVIDPLNPSKFADQITVPVFMACAWQDEQTGPFFTTLLNRFTAAPSRRFVVYNGVHSDGFAPQVMVEWKAFLDIYVARQKPVAGAVLAQLVPQLTNQIYGVEMQLPPDRFKDVTTWEAAKEKWEKESDLLVMFGNGAVEPLGTPKANFALPFSQWPAKETQAKRWYLQPGGGLALDLPTDATAASSFRLDPTAGTRGILAKGASLWKALPKYDWKAPAAGDVAGFSSAPLTEDVLMMGTGSVDLWLRSPGAGVTDADIEVNLSEVRADGQERYVQSGWLRASFRKLTAESTELWPEPSLQYADVAPLEVGKWTQVRVAIAGFGHLFRKGSRIRLAVDTPGDSRVDWRFELLKFPEQTRYDIGHSSAQPSSVALPVLEGVSVPESAALAACPSLRGQQCRVFLDLPNSVALP